MRVFGLGRHINGETLVLSARVLMRDQGLFLPGFRVRSLGSRASGV